MPLQVPSALRLYRVTKYVRWGRWTPIKKEVYLGDMGMLFHVRWIDELGWSQVDSIRVALSWGGNRETETSGYC